MSAEPSVLSAVERLFDAVATAAPRLFGDKLCLIPMVDGRTVELRSGARMTTFLVDHQPVGGGAMGCLLELGGVRIVYSGDTRPTPRLVEAARCADLLVHEAGGLEPMPKRCGGWGIRPQATPGGLLPVSDTSS